MTLVLAIDQGTTATTALVVHIKDSLSGIEVISKGGAEVLPHYPHPGWVEHSLEALWGSVATAVSQAFEKAKVVRPGFHPKQLAALGLTNQRETLCIFDRQGLPVRPAIVWQCKRSESLCATLKGPYEALLREKTGLICDPYFTGSKIRWALESDPSLKRSLHQGNLRLGTVDTYLLSRFTDGKSFATEPSNASRTLLYNLHTGGWDPELMDLWGVPCQDVLPTILDSAGVFGSTKNVSFLPDGIPITGMLGDQQAALVGQGCMNAGDLKVTYGTGAFLLQNTGTQMHKAPVGLLSTVAYRLQGRCHYALEGAVLAAGASVQFARDQLGFISSSQDSEDLAQKAAEASPQVYFVGALAGLGTPYWNPQARGAFLGLSRDTTKEQMMRAVLEGIAFQVHHAMDALAQHTQETAPAVRVDGGACTNTLLMQLQADLSQRILHRAACLDTTALGAAVIAGLGAGLGLEYSTDGKAHTGWAASDAVFRPQPMNSTQKALWTRKHQGWNRAVSAVQLFSALE